MNNKFPIGFWNYPSLEMTELSDVDDWADCGMTLIMSPQFNHETSDKQKMLALLDRCHERNLDVIVCDSRAKWKGASTDEEAYRKGYREAYADFGNHPAVVGFYVGDEPHKSDNEDVYAACRIQLEEAPEKIPYLNLFPFYNVPDEFGHTDYAFGYKDYNEWIDDFIPKCKLSVLSYDRYTQMNEGKKGVYEYFEDLKIHYDLAKKLGIPMWTTLLCVGHFRYRMPSYEDLLWQFNTAVASGCKGIMWFYFRQLDATVNYRRAPINMLGQRTNTYYDLAEVLNSFHAVYGNLFQELDLDECYHVGESLGGYPLLRKGENDYVLKAEPVFDISGILSFFKSKSGDKYIAVVNNSTKESGKISLTLSGKIKELRRIYINRNERDIIKYHHDEGFEVTKEGIVYSPWLAPGQMNLYRIVE